ncbi:helix-turn-helix transcriptional regulator [Aeromonas veronii]|uniref:helix-turn-helix transcriptional regulator n=1 Tax=Aeromonas veronii TaxID=654 RepID=UPI0015E71701|nr:AraC family transcriptional regulator [Aeromonas veronii]MBA2082347.1 AraC family transcriptional regulator [Aeromonas veronii]MBL0614092.1 helix-turn-helix transcriptional regulator [Aeromonas veronii]MCF5841167.1 AraC family transcriptional regulator [Aeromonas veronii]MCF5887194.1 AraC family transcriptional regulator [Aeromonas veronii]
MPFASECLEIAPACEEQMLGREGLPLLGEAGIFLTGLSRVRDHYLIRRNRPEFHILMVSHDEGGALLTDEGEQAIPAGSLIFLPAAVPGGLKLIGESWQISWILLDDVPRWQHLYRLGHRIWQGDGGDQLYHLLSLMQGEGVRSPLQPQLLSLLLALLERTLQGEVRGTPELRLQALFRRVEARLDEPWSVALLARQMACSVPHLHRLCQQAFGMGPMARVTELRMNKARQLLLYTNWPLGELAARVGYSDGANFANRFRRLTGQTPGAFRRLGRKPFATDVQTL